MAQFSIRGAPRVRMSATATASGGVTAGNELPSWLAGKALFEVVAVPNSASVPGVNVDAWNGFAVTPTGEAIFAAAGGHSDSSANAVVGLNLNVDSPSWTTRKATAETVTADVSHYGDGSPVSRHTYHSTFYNSATGRIFLVGAEFAYINAFSFKNTDAFNLATNQWEAANTYASLPTVGTFDFDFGKWSDGTDIWTNGLKTYTPASNTWNLTRTTSAPTDLPKEPWAYDSTRQQGFGLCYGDGRGASLGLGLLACRRPITGSTATAVSFNSSSALTQWLADVPNGAGMDYSPDQDAFFFYDGRGSAAGRLYRITPNSGNTWDMSIQTLTGATLPASVSAGVVGRVKYVAALKAIVIMPSNSSGMYAFRVG